MRLVEKMAKAMCGRAARSANENLSITDISTLIESLWEMYEPDAFAALEAMREPSDAVLDAGRDHFFRNHPFGAKGIWDAMIEAAILEQNQ